MKGVHEVLGDPACRVAYGTYRFTVRSAYYFVQCNFLLRAGCPSSEVSYQIASDNGGQLRPLDVPSSRVLREAGWLFPCLRMTPQVVVALSPRKRPVNRVESKRGVQRNLIWLPASLCLLARSAVRREIPYGFLERQGFYEKQRPAKNPLMWFHANSAGAINASCCLGAECSMVDQWPTMML